MAGMSENGIFAYDLEPPTPLLSTPLPPLPEYSPLRHPGTPSPRPRYAPPPLPEGFARVELDDDYYTGPEFSDWVGDEAGNPVRVFDIPREQRERWVAARDAYCAMQEEIDALRHERSQTFGWVRASGWVRKDKPYQAQP